MLRNVALCSAIGAAIALSAQAQVLTGQQPQGPQQQQPRQNSQRSDRFGQGIVPGFNAPSPQAMRSNNRERRWSRGERLPDQFRNDRYSVNDWQQHGLRRPPSGYRWYRDDSNNFFLAMIATGVLSDAIYRSDREDMWHRGYSRYYNYNDDLYYQQCRRSPDPAGILLGGLIGGVLGNATGHGGAGSTIAGVILGGTVGAALTRNMDCEDRSYAYRSYYDGFNSGMPGSYQWRNPRNGHYGRVNIDSYYSDPYGFRCARFNQTTYIQGGAYPATGEACRQPDGSWAVVG